MIQFAKKKKNKKEKKMSNNASMNCYHKEMHMVVWW